MGVLGVVSHYRRGHEDQFTVVLGTGMVMGTWELLHGAGGGDNSRRDGEDGGVE